MNVGLPLLLAAVWIPETLPQTVVVYPAWLLASAAVILWPRSTGGATNSIASKRVLFIGNEVYQIKP
jgi:hypothetical protein